MNTDRKPREATKAERLAYVRSWRQDQGLEPKPSRNKGEFNRAFNTIGNAIKNGGAK
jgi:hypothetical protein